MSDCRYILRPGCQMMVYPDFDFTTNLEVGINKHIEGMADHALGRVFDRDQAIVGMAGFHRVKDIGNAAHWNRRYGMAEVLECSALCESAFRTKVSNL